MLVGSDWYNSKLCDAIRVKRGETVGLCVGTKPGLSCVGDPENLHPRRVYFLSAGSRAQCLVQAGKGLQKASDSQTAPPPETTLQSALSHQTTIGSALAGAMH